MVHSLFALVLLAQTSSAPLTENTLTLGEGAPRPEATIEDVAWLEGYWTGEGLGGMVEEIWSAPAAGTLLGSLRVIKDGKVQFYEAFVIAEHEGSLVLRLKHMNPDFTGWEEKDEVVTFPLVEIRDREAYFDGLTYRRSGDHLEAYVVAGKKDGSRSEYAFRYSLRE